MWSSQEYHLSHFAGPCEGFEEWKYWGDNQLVVDFPNGCDCEGGYIPNWSCFSSECGFDYHVQGWNPGPKLAASYSGSGLRSIQGFIDLSVSKDGVPDSTKCFKAKGYLQTSEELGEGVISRAGIGHGLWGLDEYTTIEDGIKNVKAPGLYWQQGGRHATSSDEKDCFYDPGRRLWFCGGTCTQDDETDLCLWDCEEAYSHVTEAQGKFVDVCAEMDPSVDTHCTGLSKKDCKKVNTCGMVDGECVYKPQW